jgi:ssDNA thymidine ADP-ribosyltransferase, DarT
MQLKPNYQDFQNIINQRQIERIVHFTRFESITAIVGEGKILPRNQLHNISSDWQELVMPNTERRRDDTSFLNTSIMHPNVYLMNIFRDKWHQGSRFCVIGIIPEYIYEAETKFSISNATYQPAIKFGINGSLRTFNEMFAQQVSGKFDRRSSTYEINQRKSTLPDYYTTDTEAEVLIRCEIPYNDIIFIACRDKFEHDILASAFDILELPTEKLCVEATFFESRR